MKNYFRETSVKRTVLIGSFFIALFVCLWNFTAVTGWLGKFAGVFAPVTVGFVIAFILNVPMNQIESGVFRGEIFKHGKGIAVKRILSILMTFIGAFLVVTFVALAVVPQLSNTVSQLIEQIPSGVESLENRMSDLFNNTPMLQELSVILSDSWTKILEGLMNALKNIGTNAASSGISAVGGIFSGIATFVIGLIFSIYMMYNKEKLSSHCKKVLYAFVRKDRADRTLAIGKFTKYTFERFISGQCLEAFILGMLFLITMLILKLPYALLISMLIMISALIPIVGAFIGCILGALLILLVSPAKMFLFLILFIVIQQFEGHVIYPKVVGKSVGLPGIWVLFAVIVGGELFGAIGMLVFIPLVSVIYSLLRILVNERLAERNISIKQEQPRERHTEKPKI